MTRHPGNDATLVIPLPRGAQDAYAHLGAFARGGSSAQQQALWKGVAAAIVAKVSATPLWLSTAGAGVAWLHLRVDDAPKYFAHGPYRGAAHPK